MDGVFKEELKSDVNVFLCIAEHCQDELLDPSFDCAALSLLNDKDFIVKAITLNPIMHCFALEETQSNFDVVTALAAGSLKAAWQVLQSADPGISVDECCH